MPEPGNDRLESFFKKVSGRPDISFNEADWKKLEARLDAKDMRSSVARRNRNRIAGASLIAVLMVGGIYWLTQLNPFAGKQGQEQMSKVVAENQKSSIPSVAEPTSSGTTKESNKGESLKTRVSPGVGEMETPKGVQNTDVNPAYARNENLGNASTVNPISGRVEIVEVDPEQVETHGVEILLPAITTIPNNDINSNNVYDEIKSSPATADKIKQKASIADSVVMEKDDAKVIDAYGSGLTEHPPSPRLSLLLSIAPDFSTVAFDHYEDPGQAFGLMLHYHIKRSWSFSAGVVKSFKKYVGDGEDYQPPNGYWKNNTNGIIPETIDGSCNVLEIPVMVQYTIANKGKSRFLVGAGASSYIMLNESYKYNFEQPNPGAKEGWNSKQSSAMFFNVINVTAGFEHRVFPGFMMGIEPYLKIPIEGVGWSNLNLYSVGASFTLRYIILKQKDSSVAAFRHGPG